MSLKLDDIIRQTLEAVKKNSTGITWVDFDLIVYESKDNTVLVSSCSGTNQEVSRIKFKLCTQDN